MEPSVLHNQLAAYTDQDNLAYLWLGLARAASEFVELVESSPPANLVDQHSVVDPHPQPDDLTDFLLGVYAFALHLNRVFTPIFPGSSSDPESLLSSGVPPARSHIVDILR